MDLRPSGLKWKLPNKALSVNFHGRLDAKETKPIYNFDPKELKTCLNFDIWNIGCKLLYSALRYIHFDFLS